MKILPIVSYLGLALVIAPPIAYLAGALDKSAMSSVMLAGTIVWFGSVPFWMGRKDA
jgi:hypothetical protein